MAQGQCVEISSSTWVTRQISDAMENRTPLPTAAQNAEGQNLESFIFGVELIRKALYLLTLEGLRGPCDVEISRAQTRPRGRASVTCMVTGIWDWQEGRMHGTPLAEAPWASAELQPPRRATSACVRTSSRSIVYKISKFRKQKNN